MAQVQLGVVGQDRDVSGIVALGAPASGYAVRLIADDAYATSKSECMRLGLVIEKAIEQDTFPSAYQVGGGVQYSGSLGAGYENLVIGVAGGGSNTALRVIIDLSVADPITTKVQALLLTRMLLNYLATYKYPFS